jgi:hypothetical protein
LHNKSFLLNTGTGTGMLNVTPSRQCWQIWSILTEPGL